MDCDCPIWAAGRTARGEIPRQSTGTRDLKTAEAILAALISTDKKKQADGPVIEECIQKYLASHDSIRQIPGGFDRLARGVEAIHRLRPEFPISARSTVQRENFRYLRATAHTARSLGLKSVSFLAADLTETAFNRPDGWPPARQAEIALAEADSPELDGQISALLNEWRDSHFLGDSPKKLRPIALHFRAHLGLCEPETPRCAVGFRPGGNRRRGPALLLPRTYRNGRAGPGSSLEQPGRIGVSRRVGYAHEPDMPPVRLLVELELT